MDPTYSGPPLPWNQITQAPDALPVQSPERNHAAPDPEPRPEYFSLELIVVDICSIDGDPARTSETVRRSGNPF